MGLEGSEMRMTISPSGRACRFHVRIDTFGGVALVMEASITATSLAIASSRSFEVISAISPRDTVQLMVNELSGCPL
jgi:hypothetical protein